MKYFLGIDGGGTHTTAWLMDERGRVVGRAVDGPSNPLKAGFEQAEEHLLGAIAGALAALSNKAVSVDTVCAGIAGVDRAVVFRRVMSILRKGIRARRYLLTTDAAITLEAALGDRPGIVVISGTGSIALGRDSAGALLRCGGWGNIFSDEGSGCDLGRKAIVAALRDYDGRGPRTLVTRSLTRALKIRKVTEVAAAAPAPRELAALFPVVLRAARRGDAVARALCDEAAGALAELALTLVRRLDFDSGARIFCAGGVFHASQEIRRNFAARVHRAARGSTVLLSPHEPVEGALRIARCGGSNG